MAAPAIGRRRRWAPGPGAKVDWTHPLIPTVAWVPSMGLRTIHGDTVVATSGGGSWKSTAAGQAWLPGSNTSRMGFRNRLVGTLGQVTFAVWYTIPTFQQDAGILFTRGAGINATGLAGASGTAGTQTWTLSWNDDAATYNYAGGPTLVSGGQMLAAVVDVTAQTIDFWANGTKAATNSGLSMSALNFSALSGNAWETGDNLGASTRTLLATTAIYAIWGRKLSPSEIASLNADPFQFLRF